MVSSHSLYKASVTRTQQRWGRLENANLAGSWQHGRLQRLAITISHLPSYQAFHSFITGPRFKRHGMGKWYEGVGAIAPGVPRGGGRESWLGLMTCIWTMWKVRPVCQGGTRSPYHHYQATAYYRTTNTSEPAMFFYQYNENKLFCPTPWHNIEP